MKYLAFLSILFLSVVLISCDQRTDYERLVDRELASGVRNDTLFLGYELGMERQDFFNHSWELNQQKIVTGNSQVHYKMEELSSDATMTFYPDFKNDKIVRMPVEISFDSWAIWNRDLYSDSLVVEILDLYKDTYGSDFIHTVHPELKKESWIKIDGNRRISIYRKDDMKVRVEFLDLTAE